jgi:surface polysaccharide O-acyltransferase-like enzyme
VAGISFWALPVALLLSGPAAGDRAAGGCTVEAVVYACWEPFVAWGLILGLLRLAARGRVWFLAPLGRRAYGVFVIHPPILVAVSLAWREIAAPPLLKVVVTGTVATALCFVLADLLLRVPFLRRVL